MKDSVVFIAMALAILGMSAWLCADPPAERKSGKVLILPNQRTMEGDIERVGDRYRIRREHGELWLPVDKAVYLCSDWDDAYNFMAAQSNLLDPDERMRLARWCQTNGMHERALKELHFVLELRPKDTAAQQLKMVVEQQARSSSKRADPSLKTVGFEAPASLDVGIKSLAMFSSRVQPTLMNACARCHAADKNIPFRLFRVTETNFRNALQNNLVSALAQIDMESPELSPLLSKAVSLHGGCNQPPLNGRDSVAFQTMRAWVGQVLESNPHLRAQRNRSVARARQVPDDEPTPMPNEAPVARAMPNNLPSVTTEPLTQAAPVQVSRDPAPAVAAAPLDPYDPGAFNKMMHPQRN